MSGLYLSTCVWRITHYMDLYPVLQDNTVLYDRYGLSVGRLPSLSVRARSLLLGKMRFYNQKPCQSRRLGWTIQRESTLCRISDLLLPSCLTQIRLQWSKYLPDGCGNQFLFIFIKWGSRRNGGCCFFLKPLCSLTDDISNGSRSKRIPMIRIRGRPHAITIVVFCTDYGISWKRTQYTIISRQMWTPSEVGTARTDHMHCISRTWRLRAQKAQPI